MTDIVSIQQTLRQVTTQPQRRNSQPQKAPTRPPKPRALPVRFDTIAPELKQLERWIVWRYWWNPEKGRWEKPPYSAHTGRKTKPQAGSEWATFEEARAAYERGGWDGIGLVLGDGIAGADGDHCIINGELSEEAAATVARLGTYTERSPSGTGWKAFAYCSQPFNDKKGSALELYNTPDRYFTVTGHHLPGTPHQLHDSTHELHDLHREHFPPAAPRPTPDPRPAAAVNLSDNDAALLERARNNPTTGGRFRALYDQGDLSEYQGDHSAGDLALCNNLAYWTNGDAGAIDRLFRASALYRAKWNEVHRPRDGATYGEMTIEKALDGLQGGYTPRKVDAASTPDTRALEARLEAMEARLAESEAENARLRRFVSSAEKILTADKGEGWQVTTKMVELYTQLELFKNGEGSAIDRGASSIAEAVGISTSTASTHLKRLREAGLVHWRTEANLYDRRRQLVDKREAQDRDDPLHWETESIVIPLPLPGDLPALERTEYDEKQLDKAEENRKRLKLAEAILEKVVCPCCGVPGEVHASCQACGEVFTREHDAVRGALAPGFEVQNQEDWPGFEVQNDPEPEPAPPVLKFKTREATPGFEVQTQGSAPVSKIEPYSVEPPKIETGTQQQGQANGFPHVPTVGGGRLPASRPPPTVESVESCLPSHLAECPLEPEEPPPGWEDEYPAAPRMSQPRQSLAQLREAEPRQVVIGEWRVPELEPAAAENVRHGAQGPEPAAPEAEDPGPFPNRRISWEAEPEEWLRVI